MGGKGDACKCLSLLSARRAFGNWIQLEFQQVGFIHPLLMCGKKHIYIIFLLAASTARMVDRQPTSCKSFHVW
jgi:hypothetical protein